MAVAIFLCCGNEQLSSIDKITGYSEVANAWSLMVRMTSMNLILVVKVWP